MEKMDVEASPSSWLDAVRIPRRLSSVGTTCSPTKNATAGNDNERHRHAVTMTTTTTITTLQIQQEQPKATKEGVPENAHTTTATPTIAAVEQPSSAETDNNSADASAITPPELSFTTTTNSVAAPTLAPPRLLDSTSSSSSASAIQNGDAQIAGSNEAVDVVTVAETMHPSSTNSNDGESPATATAAAGSNTTTIDVHLASSLRNAPPDDDIDSHHGSLTPNCSSRTTTSTRKNLGKWTQHERDAFSKALAVHGSDLEPYARWIKTRSPLQIKCYYALFQRYNNNKAAASVGGGGGPPTTSPEDLIEKQHARETSSPRRETLRHSTVSSQPRRAREEETTTTRQDAVQNTSSQKKENAGQQDGPVVPTALSPRRQTLRSSTVSSPSSGSNSNKNRNTGRWTEDEKKAFRCAHAQLGDNLAAYALWIPSRSRKQISCFYSVFISGKLESRHYEDLQEDEVVAAAAGVDKEYNGDGENDARLDKDEESGHTALVENVGKKQVNTGKWTEEEKQTFREAYAKFGDDLRKYDSFIHTRTHIQIRCYYSQFKGNNPDDIFKGGKLDNRHYEDLREVEDVAAAGVDNGDGNAGAPRDNGKTDEESGHNALVAGHVGKQRKNTGRWTEEEKQAFRTAYEQFGDDFRKYYQFLPTRNETQIRCFFSRWFKGSIPDSNCHDVLQEEDADLVDGADEPKASSDNLQNHTVAVGKNTGRWTEDEALAFRQAYAQFGDNLEAYASMIPTRQPRQIACYYSVFKGCHVDREDLSKRAAAAIQQRASALCPFGSHSGPFNTGRWTAEEKATFLRAYAHHGENLEAYALLIKTRTPRQISCYYSQFKGSHLGRHDDTQESDAGDGDDGYEFESESSSAAASTQRQAAAPKTYAGRKPYVRKTAASKLHPGKNTGRWTEDEALAFRQAYAQFGDNLEAYASMIPTRLPQQISCYFSQFKGSNLGDQDLSAEYPLEGMYGSWTKAEKLAFRKLYAQHSIDFKKYTRFIPTRTLRQISHYYCTSFKLHEREYQELRERAAFVEDSDETMDGDNNVQGGVYEKFVNDWNYGSRGASGGAVMHDRKRDRLVEQQGSQRGVHVAEDVPHKRRRQEADGSSHAASAVRIESRSSLFAPQQDLILSNGALEEHEGMHAERYCQIYLTDQLDHPGTCVGFITLSSCTCTFADARTEILETLETEKFPSQWRFLHPSLGPVSIKLETKAGSMISYLRKGPKGKDVGVGSLENPAKVTIMAAPLSMS